MHRWATSKWLDGRMNGRMHGQAPTSSPDSKKCGNIDAGPDKWHPAKGRTGRQAVAGSLLSLLGDLEALGTMDATPDNGTGNSQHATSYMRQRQRPSPVPASQSRR
jgi:hypothetical protein